MSFLKTVIKKSVILFKCPQTYSLSPCGMWHKHGSSLQSHSSINPFNSWSLFLLSANMGSTGTLGNTVNVLEEKIVNLQKARLQVSVMITEGLWRRWWRGLSQDPASCLSPPAPSKALMQCSGGHSSCIHAELIQWLCCPCQMCYQMTDWRTQAWHVFFGPFGTSSSGTFSWSQDPSTCSDVTVRQGPWMSL